MKQFGRIFWTCWRIRAKDRWASSSVGSFLLRGNLLRASTLKRTKSKIVKEKKRSPEIADYLLEKRVFGNWIFGGSRCARARRRSSTLQQVVAPFLRWCPSVLSLDPLPFKLQSPILLSCGPNESLHRLVWFTLSENCVRRSCDAFSFLFRMAHWVLFGEHRFKRVAPVLIIFN